MSRAPIVAVTATSEIVRGALRFRVNAAYVRAVERAGGVPVVVPPLARATGAERILDAADALLLTGGEDVDPARYGAARHPASHVPNAERDATELALVARARELRIPTLAICRGIQLLNVALGGTLVQDIPTERPGALEHDQGERRDQRVHEVTVDEGSRLAAALGGAGTFPVNSFHHQAVATVAHGLRVTALAPDGIVEGVEWSDADWWVLGVQWHPEELDRSPEPWERSLFSSLVEAARDQRVLDGA